MAFGLCCWRPAAARPSRALARIPGGRMGGRVRGVHRARRACRQRGTCNRAERSRNTADSGRDDRFIATAAMAWKVSETPLDLPWGRRVEIDLDHAEIADQIVPVSGGLRANLYLNGRTDDIANDFLAGDPVQILMKARQSRDFKDPGAFDVRRYLARQQIDLTGALRSGLLLESLGDTPMPWRYRFAIVQGKLLTRIDALFPDRPERAAVLRAMLLGDWSFVDRQTVRALQKTELVSPAGDRGTARRRDHCISVVARTQAASRPLRHRATRACRVGREGRDRPGPNADSARRVDRGVLPVRATDRGFPTGSFRSLCSTMSKATRYCSRSRTGTRCSSTEADLLVQKSCEARGRVRTSEKKLCPRLYGHVGSSGLTSLH